MKIMKILNYFFCATLALSVVTSANSASFKKDDLKNKVTGKISNFKSEKINQYSTEISNGISSFLKENLSSMKYLDFQVDVREETKPTFSIMSVNELTELANGGTIFNQTSFNTYDGDETINIGLGARKLLNDNKVIIGFNTFYDHQFSENHKRLGLGAEAITSMLDLRGNYYNAMSGRKNVKTGDYLERALDGWDVRADYHLPIQHDVNLYVKAFEFKNPERASTYEQKGSTYGADAKIGNIVVDGGYTTDNQDKDYWFSSVKYVLNLGPDSSSNEPKKALGLIDVSDQLYQPVKRENKIRVVRIAASGLEVAGF
tara:strand:+ start:257 stop:1204 length:948 start_codon:yes stop_codon:yes gene_type:complete